MSNRDSDFLNSFLECGWFLALDSERIFVGWGEGAGTANKEAHIFAPDFYLQQLGHKAEIRMANWEVFERSRFASLVLSGLRSNVNSDQRFQWVEPSQSEFETQFLKIREGMADRGLKKAVPVVFARAQAEMNRDQRLRILASVLKQPTHLYPYGFWKNGEGMIGVTPEILFSQSTPQRFETVALAGTRAKGQNENASAAALLADAKERHEHQLVIDDIVHVLEKTGRAHISETGVVVLPTLIHLKTEISGELREPVEFEQLAKALHPTPALGLAPRALGFDEMKNWEASVDRLRYGAPFGVRYQDESGNEQRHCVVAIRNIQWQDSQILLGSGCGIVPASDVAREWQELQLKRDSVKKMLDV